MTMSALATLITELGVLFGVVAWVVNKYKKTAAKVELVAEGVKCQLRSDMLRVYYRNKDTKEIRQYEYENFVMLYEAYKALGGNSFVDKISDEVKSWKIET